MTSTDFEPEVVRGTWAIDRAHSTLAFAARHAMVSTVRGRFSEFSGSLTIDPDDPSKTTAEVDIAAASLDTRHPDRDGHLKSPDFLDVERFPKLTFRSTRAEAGDEPGRYRLWGDLTIRDVTREVELDIEFHGLATDPFGNLRAGFEGQAVINRKDWGMVWNVALEKGGILVGDKVKLSLDIGVIKQV